MNNRFNIKNFLATHGVGYYLTLPAIVFAVAALILYEQTGVTEFNPQIDSSATVSIIVGVALALVAVGVGLIPSAWGEYLEKPLLYASYLVIFYAFIRYIGSQATYIANVFVAIDGNSFTAGFICTFVFFIISFVLALLSGCLLFWRPWAKKDTVTIVEEVG
ncbi:MAG: hypothetical protein ACI4MH_01005 [Candidatus Coproplasma sp.]